LSDHDRRNNGVKLRNFSGVPVIELVGEFNSAAVRTIESVMHKLADAGHYHLVVNVKRAAGVNPKVLASLAGALARIRKSYGMVDLVAEAGQVQDLPRMRKLAGLFRLNSSEAQAIGKIKRLLRLPDDSVAGTSARITE
jgi:hypothetical protein